MKDISPNCTFDCHEHESIEHILLHCPYAKSVWATEPSTVDLNFDRSISFLDVCKEWIGKEKPNHSNRNYFNKSLVYMEGKM